MAAMETDTMPSPLFDIGEMQAMMDGMDDVEHPFGEMAPVTSPTTSYGEKVFKGDLFNSKSGDLLNLKSGYLKNNLLTHSPSDVNTFANDLNDLLTQYHEIADDGDFNPYPTPAPSRGSISSASKSSSSGAPSPASFVMSPRKRMRSKDADAAEDGEFDSDLFSPEAAAVKSASGQNQYQLANINSRVLGPKGSQGPNGLGPNGLLGPKGPNGLQGPNGPSLVVNIPKQLTDLLQSKGDELLQSYVDTYAAHCTVSNWKHFETEKYRVPCEIAKVVGDGCVSGTVSFVKSLDGFRALSEDDRVALVKGAWLEMQVWKFLFVLNREGTHWGMMDKNGEIKEFGIELAFGSYGCGVMEQFLNLARQMGSLRFDRKLMVIVYSVVIFHPDRDLLVQKDFVRDFQELYYMRILREYLVTAYAEPEVVYSKVLAFIEEIRAIGDQIKRIVQESFFLRNVFLTTATPVVIELFGLAEVAS